MGWTGGICNIIRSLTGWLDFKFITGCSLGLESSRFVFVGNEPMTQGKQL